MVSEESRSTKAAPPTEGSYPRPRARVKRGAHRGMCAVGFSELSSGRRTVGPGTRGGATGCNRARRGAEDPASGLHARAKCAGSGDAREPAPGPRDRTGTDGSAASRSAGVGPKPAPAKAGGTGPYNERIRSRRPARTWPDASAVITDSAKPTRVRARDQAMQEVRLELEAAVHTGVDPFQGRAPAVATLPCEAPAGGWG